jgi:[ribosomal protein S5]-alanine N-acetyltransferase
MKLLEHPGKTESELIGKRLRLREVRTSDASGAYLEWMNDAEVLKYTESRHQSHSKEDLCDYVIKINANPDFVFRAITLGDTGRHIGNIKLGPIDWNHRFGDIGIIIGAKDCWGKNYAVESIRLLADYAFSVLKMHKLTAGCYAVNEAGIKAFIKAGFVREGLRNSQYVCDGRYVDLVYLGLINPVDSPSDRAS